jgi:hypothetical protein
VENIMKEVKNVMGHQERPFNLDMGYEEGLHEENEI